MIKFLDLQKITQKYSDEIHEAVSRVINSGWYLHTLCLGKCSRLLHLQMAGRR